MKKQDTFPSSIYTIASVAESLITNCGVHDGTLHSFKKAPFTVNKYSEDIEILYYGNPVLIACITIDEKIIYKYESGDWEKEFISFAQKLGISLSIGLRTCVHCHGRVISRIAFDCIKECKPVLHKACEELYSNK